MVIYTSAWNPDTAPQAVKNWFAYALAKSRGEVLLFKGEDFSQTDLSAA